MFRTFNLARSQRFVDLATGTNNGWRDELVLRHPELFRGTAHPEVDDGWADLIDRAVERIAEAAKAGRSPVRIVQIKEKYGELRIYTDRVDDTATAAAVDEAIALATARSACTCEVCGAEGRLHERGDIFATACEHHAKGSPVEVRPGWENIRITRALREGRVRIVSCRRYDRNADAFVDVPPFALGIKE
jgi:hypothetical protein